MNKLWILMLVVLSAATVYAANDTQSQALDVRYEHLGCKVDLTNAQIDIATKYIGNDSALQQSKNELAADMNALKTIKDSENKTQFDSYIEETIRPDFHNATEQLNALKGNWRSYNLTSGQREAFKDDVKKAVDDYKDCVSNKEEAMSKVLVKHYDNIEKQWQKIIEQLKKRGMNTTEIEQVYSEMQGKLAALENATNTSNKTQIRQTINDMRQEYLHLWTRFEKGRLDSYMEKMNDYAKKNNKTANVNKTKDKLKDIDQYIVPGYKYKDGDAEKVWKTLVESGKDLKETSKSLLKQQQEQRKEQRQQLIDNRKANRSAGEPQ